MKLLVVHVKMAFCDANEALMLNAENRIMQMLEGRVIPAIAWDVTSEQKDVPLPDVYTSGTSPEALHEYCDAVAAELDAFGPPPSSAEPLEVLHKSTRNKEDR